MDKPIDRSGIVTGKHAPGKRVTAYEMRRVMTSAERVLWTHLRASRLGGFHFRRQQVIDGFIVDFYCHAAGLVLEADGDVHDATRDEDAARDHVLATRGLRVLRYRNEQILQNTESVLKDILEACKKQSELIRRANTADSSTPSQGVE